MKKLMIAVACLFLANIANANACPAGRTHPVGGTGSHYKGGTCQLFP